MTEVDIWIEVLKSFEMRFIDEVCNSDTNILKYEWCEYRLSLSFDRKTESVTRLLVDHFLHNNDRLYTSKSTFESDYKTRFRDAKIKLLLDNDMCK